MSENAQGLLDGKVAVVTGASRNIGRATAPALADEGAAVVVGARRDAEAARDVAEEISAAGGRSLARIADITDEAAVGAMAEAAVQAFGRIDILLNNASPRRQQPIAEMTLAQWREIMAVILDGAFLCARACVPHMIAAGGGAIVNIGGVSAHVGARNRAHVMAAKSGLVGLTTALALELAEHGITANCVVPGTIDTLRGASAGKRPVLANAALIDRLWAGPRRSPPWCGTSACPRPATSPGRPFTSAAAAICPRRGPGVTPKARGFSFGSNRALITAERGFVNQTEDAVYGMVAMSRSR